MGGALMRSGKYAIDEYLYPDQEPIIVNWRFFAFPKSYGY